MATEVWIVYKAEDMDAPGWEERKIMPRGSLTDILWENWSSEKNLKLPQPGDRTRDYRSGDRALVKEGDWLVSRVEQFSSFDTDTRIVVAYCQYEPVEGEWQELKRGQPVGELLEEAESAFSSP